ncbi:MAG: low specificity L-threonine aldolase [Fretibacterium sp.]|nr:low specificity L-threonine aldolase [Fretibacterium sp.]
MIRFDSDYLEGCHPRILERLAATNLEQTQGYGIDPHCARAADLIRKACSAPSAAVHFLVGGTQTNATVIKSLLRPQEGVICADTGHINVHESGAIEATGHKVLPLPTEDGTLTAGQVREALQEFYADPTREHRVQPGMLYISHPSENGTLYTREGLSALRVVCQEYGIPIYLDGARLGYGLTAEGTDLSLPELIWLCDAFYIGGTKCGALFGEAVVLPDPNLIRGFRTLIKQQGGLLAKGRLLGLQFEVLFEDGLYFDIAAHANRQACRIRDAFCRKGYELLYDSPTNQQFPILPEQDIARLQERFSFEHWQKTGPGAGAKNWAVRFCTSWATTKEQTDKLIQAIEEL